MTRKTLLSSALITLAVFGLGFAAAAQFSTAKTNTNAPAATLTVVAPFAAGTFSGLSDHETRGQVHLVETAQGYALVLGADFFLDGAPDPSVGFGKDGTYIPATHVADLQSKRGEQTYQLPTNFTPADYNEVYIWCDKFSVPLGVAVLSAA